MPAFVSSCARASVSQRSNSGRTSSSSSSSSPSSSIAESFPTRKRFFAAGGARREGRRIGKSPIVLLRPKASAVADAALDLSREVRGDFPILDSENEMGMSIVYLDSAATSQKPKEVLAAHGEFYKTSNANVHRGVHYLSARATDMYEQSRAKVAKFINAKTDREIVFTRNASEALNLVCNTWGEKNIKEGDEIVLSVAEHHSNIVPWQLLAERKGAVLKFIGLDENECLDLDELERTVSAKTKLVSLPHVSNVLGFTSDVERIVKTAKSVNATVVLDACQSVPHMPVDVQKLGADFIVASGHKMCGPTGIGFLWGKYDVLSDMPPWMGGGEMIQDVYLEKSTYAPPPGRFEAGTPAIAEAVALGAACDYLSKIGMDRVQEFELALGAYLYSELVKNIPNVRIYGPNPLKVDPRTGKNFERASLAAFNVDGVNCSDICTLLDQLHGVGCRSGHHCTQPLHRHLDVLGSARASLYIYNTKEDVDKFIVALKEVLEFLGEPL